MAKKFSSDREFIRKLTEITEANLSNTHFGVNKLVEIIGISHSQIHRKLHTLTNQTTSQFIREIRLNKAKELLQMDCYTVSEIAYKVGFSSSSYFNKCYHDYFGYSPGELKKHAHINNLNAANISPEKSNQNKLLSNSKKTILTPFNIFNSTILLMLFGILLLLILSFLTYSYFNGSISKTNREKSIAVLPLRNLSNDTENQHLANGIMADILNCLSQIQGIEVKSQISANTYHSPQISINEIARNLGVSYILEGSLLKAEDNLRLYIQLVDAKNDKAVWSAKYDNDLSDIFVFVSDVSQQIAIELQTVLSPKEKEQIKKVYTTNTEAYQLYQKGRFFWHRRTEEDLNKSIGYFKESLNLDSTYALAYAGLADAYFISAWWKWYPQAEGYALGKAYAKKALELDDSLAEAHATLGAIACYYDYNWEFAEKELKQAIELNPSSADANQYYSEYLDILCRNTLARLYINKSIELSPNSKIKYYLSSIYYYNEGKMEKALKEGEKALELDKNFKKQNLKNYMIYFRLGEDKKAIDSLIKFLASYPSEDDYTQLLNTIYKKSGMPGIIHFSIDKMLQDSKVDLFFIAQQYALLCDKESCLEYLNKAFISSTQILRMKSCFDFRFISNEPEFQILLEKLNLS